MCEKGAVQFLASVGGYLVCMETQESVNRTQLPRALGFLEGGRALLLGMVWRGEVGIEVALERKYNARVSRLLALKTVANAFATIFLILVRFFLSFFCHNCCC